MSIINLAGYNLTSSHVAIIKQIVDDIVAQGTPGSGATAYVGLSDAATVNLPGTNGPLGTALAGLQALLNSGVNIKTINGSSVLGAGNLVIAGGGATAYTGLTDAATVNLPGTNTPLASALTAKQNVAATPIAFATAIPLDTIGNGKVMAQTTLAANSVFTVTGAVEGGNCTFALLGNGVNVPDLSAFVNANGYTYDTSALNIYAALRSYGANLLYGVAGAVVDTTAPAVSGAPHVDNASPTIVRQSYNEALVTNGIAIGDCTVTGHTVSAVAIAGTELRVTVSAGFANGEAARTLSVAASKLKDAAGNLCAAIVASAITNNVLAGKITFTDAFTGADGAALNGRWSGDAGWTIQSNRASFGGAAYGEQFATCTPGDNTIDVDMDFGQAGAGFGEIVISRVDANNGCWIIANGSDELSISQKVAGVNSVVTADTGHNRFTGAAPHFNITLVGQLVTVTITGGADNGGFSGTVNAAVINGAQVGMGMNGPGKDANWFDNFQLS